MSDRLRFLIMRCVACKGFLTKAEILDRWDQWERDGESKTGLCDCGSRQLKPGNLTPEEESTYCTRWQQFRYKILGRRDKKTRVWDLYYRFVKGAELGPAYGKEQ